MSDREQLRAKMIENAAEINRLHSRIHETLKHRSESDEARQEWSRACEEFHARYSQLCLPDGPHPNLYDRIKTGDPAMIEVALCFVEVRPYFFRSGYHWKTILQKCKRAPMCGEQSERFSRLLEKYTEWKKLRRQSSKRGSAVHRDLLRLLLRFYNLFPVKLSDNKFDVLVTVGDLYTILCTALKLEPSSQPEREKRVVRQPCRAVPQADMSVWAREYRAWRESVWTPEDVWATLVSTMAEVYQLNASVITPGMILREPSRE